GDDLDRSFRARMGYACRRITRVEFLRLLRLSGKAKRIEQSAKGKNGDFLLHVFPALSTRHSTLTPSHLITLSPRARTFAAIVRPIRLAALRLIINSNFIGCSTGRSAGLRPLRILSTYVAARRNMSGALCP